MNGYGRKWRSKCFSLLPELKDILIVCKKQFNYTYKTNTGGKV